MTMTLRSMQTYNLSERDAIASNTHPTLTSMLEGRFQQCPKRCKLCKRQRGMFLTSVWMQRAMLKCSSSRCALHFCRFVQMYYDVFDIQDMLFGFDLFTSMFSHLKFSKVPNITSKLCSFQGQANSHAMPTRSMCSTATPPPSAIQGAAWKL